MNTVHSARLSDEARQTIRRYLEPSMGAAEVQKLIDGYEGTVPEPPPSRPVPSAASTSSVPLTRESLFTPSARGTVEEAKEALRERKGTVYALGLAAAGQSPLFTDSLPYDSLLERSFRNARPGPELLPALNLAVTSPEPANTAQALDLAEAMFNAVPMTSHDPMQKGFTGLRLLLAVVKSMGDIRVVGLDNMSTPLRNLRDDAVSENLGRIMVMEVDKTIKELRSYLDEKGNPVVLPARIIEGADTVTIGGVTLEVRQDTP